MGSKSALVFMPAFALLMLSAGELSAAPTQAQQQAIRSSCQSDYRSYCASVPTGGSEALQCLEKNLASLSSSCQQAVKAASGASSATGSGSSGSSGPTGGASETTTAAAAPASGSSAAGGTSVTIVLEPGKAAALMRQACGADYRAHCSGERVLGGAALRCLVANAPSLSASCKGELNRLGQKF